MGEGDQVESTPVEASAQHVSHVNFGHAVGAAWDALASDTVEPIWNSGFWKCIFGDDAFGPKLENNFKRPVPVDETAHMDETSADIYKKNNVCRVPKFLLNLFSEVASRALKMLHGRKNVRHTCREHSNIGWSFHRPGHVKLNLCNVFQVATVSMHN